MPEPVSGNFPQTADKILIRKPNYLNCEAMVCVLNEVCPLDPFPDEAKDKDIYAKSVAITANLETYDPRQLKMFCWVKWEEFVEK